MLERREKEPRCIVENRSVYSRRCFGLADGETEIAEKCRTRRRRSRRRNRDKVDKVVHCLAYFRRNSMYEKLFF